MAANNLDDRHSPDCPRQTGLTREELLARLKSVLPEAVDKLTPQGRLPTEEETSQW